MKAGLSLLVVTTAASALGQQSIPLRIYAPARSIRDQKIQLQNWGSGTIGETDAYYFEGTTSIRVATRNYFQGGTMIFQEPRDLAPKFEDSTNLMRLTFFLEDAGVRRGVDALNSKSGGGAPDTIGDGGGATIPGRGKAEKTGRTPPPLFWTRIKKVRMIVGTTDGKKSEIYVPVAASKYEGNGWRSIAVPLQAISGFERTNKTVEAISLSTDTPVTLYIGALEIVSDTTPITGEVNTKGLTLDRGDEVSIQARGEGGASMLVFQWDFDDQDGVQVETEGPVGRHKFRKPGKFMVTTTVVDQYGVKRPYQIRFPVTVNP